MRNFYITWYTEGPHGQHDQHEGPHAQHGQHQGEHAQKHGQHQGEHAQKHGQHQGPHGQPDCHHNSEYGQQPQRTAAPPVCGAAVRQIQARLTATAPQNNYPGQQQ